jgi:hypothetical protein
MFFRILLVLAFVTAAIALSQAVIYQGPQGEQGSMGPAGPSGPDFLNPLPLPISKGGTQSSTLLQNGKLMVSNIKSIVEGTSSSIPTFRTVRLNPETVEQIIFASILLSESSSSIPSPETSLAASTILSVLPSAQPHTIFFPKSDRTNDCFMVLTEGDSTVRGSITFQDTETIVANDLQTPLLESSNYDLTTLGDVAVLNDLNFHFTSRNVLPRTFLTMLDTNQWTWDQNIDLLQFNNQSVPKITFRGALLSVLLEIDEDLDVVLPKTNNQLFFQNTTESPWNTTVDVQMSATQNVYSIIDTRQKTAEFLLTEGAQIVNGQKIFTDLIPTFVKPIKFLETGSQIELLPTGNREIIVDYVPTPLVSTGPFPYTIPNTNPDGTEFVMSEGDQTINGLKRFTDLDATFVEAITINATGDQLVFGQNPQQLTVTAAVTPGFFQYTIPPVTGGSFVMTEGDQKISGVKQFIGRLNVREFEASNATFNNGVRIEPTTNQIKMGSTTVNAPDASGIPLVYTIPDAGQNANFVMTVAPSGGTVLNGTKTFSALNILSPLTGSGSVNSPENIFAKTQNLLALKVSDQGIVGNGQINLIQFQSYGGIWDGPPPTLSGSIWKVPYNGYYLIRYQVSMNYATAPSSAWSWIQNNSDSSVRWGFCTTKLDDNTGQTINNGIAIVPCTVSDQISLVVTNPFPPGRTVNAIRTTLSFRLLNLS